MKKFFLSFLILFVCFNGYGEEFSYQFSKWDLVIKSQSINLKHSPQRDIITINMENKSAIAIDFDCDGIIDILFLNGKPTEKGSPHFIGIEVKIIKWKEEVGYKSLVEKWGRWKQNEKKGEAK